MLTVKRERIRQRLYRAGLLVDARECEASEAPISMRLPIRSWAAAR
jgi:hypothetical protein